MDYLYEVESTDAYGTPGIWKTTSLEDAQASYNDCVLKHPEDRHVLRRRTLENGQQVPGDVILSFHAPKPAESTNPTGTSCVVV